MAFLNVSEITADSIVDGPGIRSVVWLQGCPHACPGCHNPDTWDYEERNLLTPQQVVDKLEEFNFSKKVTISGGEPLAQELTIELIELLAQKNYNIWVYTGYELDYIENSKFKAILKNIDTIVTGKYVEALRDVTLEFRGSSNQKLYQPNK